MTKILRPLALILAGVPLDVGYTAGVSGWWSAAAEIHAATLVLVGKGIGWAYLAFRGKKKVKHP